MNTSSPNLEFDTVIVGAGSAGCLLANRLSANPNHRVLLLEAGGEDDWFWIKIPAGYLFTIANPRTDWCFKTQADPGLNQRSIHYARGKVIGGSSSINAMIYMRGQASDYARWSEMTGDPIWQWPTTLETYKSLENYYAGANPWHGDDGEMRVERPRVQWDILDAWREAAHEQGIPKIEEFNRGNNEGCAYFQMTQQRGVRWSMADAYLHPIRHRKNLTILTQAQVLRLNLKPITTQTINQSRFTQKAWHGAQHEITSLLVLHAGSKKTIHASDQVILAAGSIGSPHLLQVSGIGSRSHLFLIYPGLGRTYKITYKSAPYIRWRTAKRSTLFIRTYSLGLAWALSIYSSVRGPSPCHPLPWVHLLRAIQVKRAQISSGMCNRYRSLNLVSPFMHSMPSPRAFVIYVQAVGVGYERPLQMP